MALPPTYLITAPLVLYGAIVSSLTGFGFSIAIMPFMLLIYPPKTAVALTLSIASYGAIIQWIRVRRDADYRLVGRFCLGGAVGLPLGGFLLAVIEAWALKALVGFSVLTASLLISTRGAGSQLPPRRPGFGLSVVTGFAAGLLAASVGQPGVPVASLMAWSRWEKRVVRATLVSFFVVADIGALTVLYLEGSLTASVALTGVTMIPFYGLGMLIGDFWFHRTTQGAYRYLVLTVLAVSGGLGFFNGVKALI